MAPDDFIEQILLGARTCQRTTGIPASFTIAQAALESSWGNRAPGNNLFGIKADPSWKGPTVPINTHEVLNGQRVAITANFRAYASLGDSLVDHAKFFLDNRRYRPCFLEKTGEGWARAVAKAGYATDPGYADKLISIMDGRELAQYDKLPEVKP